MANRLLRHPVPLINESIGNYVLRLCSENSCEVKHISDLIGFNPRGGIGHYYKKLKEKNITKFSELTGMDIKVIEDMTESRFSFDKKNDFGRGIYSSVCPECYREKSYERIHWKNELIKVCLDHESYLVDYCPRCNKEITSNILFSGQCNCGLLINDFNYERCVNKYILQNQNILYQIFNIKCKVPLKESFLYNNISGENYCKFFVYLQYLPGFHAEKLKKFKIFTKTDKCNKRNVIASWIMIDWPLSLYEFVSATFEVNNKYSFTNTIYDTVLLQLEELTVASDLNEGIFNILGK